MKYFLLNVGEAILNIRYYVAKFSLLFLPTKAYPHPVTVFNWTIFKKNFRIRHALLAIFSVLIAIGGIILMETLIPFTEYSLLSGLSALVNGGFEKIAGKPAPDIIVFAINIGIFLLLISNTKDMKNIIQGNVIMSKGIPKWAMKEEIAFRSGSENWNPIQRLMASFSFGSLHMINIIYPIAAIFALTMCGLLFTAIYRYEYKRTESVTLALREAAMVHTTHNIIAFGLLAVVLIIGVPILVYQLFS